MKIRKMSVLFLQGLLIFFFQDEDTETVMENPAAEAQGGAGIQAAQFLVDQGADVLITVRCGQNAADIFGATRMKIYKSAGETAAKDVERFSCREIGRTDAFFMAIFRVAGKWDSWQGAYRKEVL